MHWLLHFMGVDNGAGPWYLFHSGFGANFEQATLNGLVLGAVFWWHHQCEVHRCYWYARRTTAANERACWRHHPHPKRTAGDIHAAHHAVLRRKHEEGSGS